MLRHNLIEFVSSIELRELSLIPTHSKYQLAKELVDVLSLTEYLRSIFA